MVRNLGASFVGVERKSTEGKTEIKIGDFKIDTTNVFTKYMQIGALDIVADPLDKAALEMASGLEIYSDNEQVQRDLTQLREEWATEIELDALTLTLLRELLEKGTVVMYCPQDQKDIREFEILPMSFITLLTTDVKPGDVPRTMMRGKIAKIYVNESSSDQIIKEDNFTLDEVILLRQNYRTHLFKDTKGRDTFGIYGRSILDKIEWRLEYYFDILESYRKYIERYGFGRLVINPELVAELIKDGKYAEAKKVLADIKTEQEKIQENQDIIAVGTTVTPIYTQSAALDIITIKESLERDISSLLYGTGVSSGKEEGTTYASARVADINRIRVLESYRQKVKVPLEALVRRQAENYGIQDPQSIRVRFSQLDKPAYTAEDLRNLVEAMILDTDEARALLGFKPIEEEVTAE